MNRSKFTTIILLAASLAACAKQNGVTGDTGSTGPQGPAAPVVVQPTPTSAQLIIQTENAYRATIGQEPLVPGLACTLYTVPNTATQIVGATLTNIGTFTYAGAFDQENGNASAGLNILPVVLQPLYTSFFIVKCIGTLAATDNNWHLFTLSSDDGSNLYVDGLLINNDGSHAITTKSAPKFLKAGIHSFELDYFELNGSQALILNEDGVIAPAGNFFH